MKRVILALLRAYKRFISPALGSNCRFTPTCSEYMARAVEVHGGLKGLALGLWRVLRCNPFGRAGYDPPPEKGRWRNPARHTWREGRPKE